jgi:hypothetical protein
MKAKRTRIILVAIGAVLLLAIAFGVGHFFGQVSMASRDLHQQSGLHLAVAYLIRTNDAARALSLLEQSLRMELYGISRWSRYTMGWQRHYLYDAARRVAAYYEEHIPDQLLLPLELDGASSEARQGYRMYIENSNLAIEQCLVEATDAREIAEFEAEFKARNEVYIKRMTLHSIKQ